MNKTSQASVLAVAAALALTGCASTASTTTDAGTQSSNAPAGLLKSSEFSICMDPTYPPLEFYGEGGSSGDPIGFDADSAAALAESWGVKPKFSVVSFDGLLPALQAKRCDAVWSGMYVSDERKEVADAVPYLATGRGLVTTSSDDSIRSLDDLAGKTVAVLAGGVNEAELKKMSADLEAKGKPAITIQSYPQNNQTAAAVRNGKADALLETDLSAAEMVAKSNGALKGNIDLFEADNQLAVYTLKGSPMTASVAEGIQGLAADGTLGEIAERYGLDPQRVIAEGK